MATGDEKRADREHGRADASRGSPALTSRAAILAVVVCAIALSLAYPVREYVAQRQEIAELRQQERVARREVDELTRRKQRLGEESYIKREATRRFHYCDPGVQCYIVLDGSGGEGQRPRKPTPSKRPPWYEALWRSVEAADRPR
ncbi:hypothetical protein Acsp03_23910 [Actinomadura sp. NBRC 104412]|uniref:septum formation initiator family protein n=1 Tax=Actinomadura sp. NBRC 104412 TaxID=3032203 RepID=UPI0024A18CA3|nr:septum formation initiator family protein [Actinomadura sp. NBRC 104412]GLZ04925.1 hypothetical protein Acsp03_23910 [Actinomadura sp. NBRC 104412]